METKWHFNDVIRAVPTPRKLKKKNALKTPVVVMTPDEEKLADRILKRHFEEDREEIYRW
jgi:hypothetical protein